MDATDSPPTNSTFTEIDEVLRTPRQRWIRDLALAEPVSLARQVHGFVTERSIQVAIVKEAEIGLCMVPARTGGLGEAFGLGEATVTRCVVAIAGDNGLGYVLGRDHTHAYFAAVSDALLQGRWSMSFEADILQPIRQHRRNAELARERLIDLTRVDFDTMVRADG
jgi:alpha-D-ribose 1-methylphosphonate 5-triphosphate synthase subunit PhnG